MTVISTMVSWLFAGLCMQFALTFMEVFGGPALFHLFSVFCIAAIIFVKFFVPETKGITLEELEANLKNGRKLRELGS